MFGKVAETPQTEQTPFYPRSPYACAKVFAYWADDQLSRELRTSTPAMAFSSTTSVRAAEKPSSRARLPGPLRHQGWAAKALFLGNLDARRDWGYAPEYVEAMWMMLQQDNPDDYVIATGETHSVREFLELAFAASISTGRNMSGTTTATSARRKSISW